jgi:RIO-like serine/threonine protein kinase
MGPLMVPIPPIIWRRAMKANEAKTSERLDFMSKDHHRVRDFAVQELTRTGEPVPTASIAEALELDPSETTRLIEDLERHLTFLYRTRPDAVTWAYPVTCEDTGHRAHFSTGEDAFSP